MLAFSLYCTIILIIVLLLRFGHYVRMPAGGDELLDTPCSVRSGNSVPANKLNLNHCFVVEDYSLRDFGSRYPRG